MSNYVIGNPEALLSTSALREYCDNGRRVLRPLYTELRIAGEELEAALRYVPVPNSQFGALDSRVRARLVASHLRHSAQAVEVAVASLVRTYLSYRRHFLDDTQPDRRPQFRVDQ